MDTGDEEKRSQCVNALHYLKPHWKIVRDGLPLALCNVLELLPATAMIVFSGHDSLDSLDIIYLFIAAYLNFIDVVSASAGPAIQVNCLEFLVNEQFE